MTKKPHTESLSVTYITTGQYSFPLLRYNRSLAARFWSAEVMISQQNNSTVFYILVHPVVFESLLQARAKTKLYTSLNNFQR
jgi:hypothetical protein